MTFEDWKKEKEAKGEEVHITMVCADDRGNMVKAVRPIESLVEQANNLITNKYNLSMKSLLEMRKMFKEKNGMTPEEVIEKNENKEL